MFEKYMIVDGSEKNIKEDNIKVGFMFEARLPYYRGIALSMVEDIEVNINGEVIAQDNISIEVGGTLFDIVKREEATEVRWEMGQIVSVIVFKKDGLSIGTHILALKMNLRIGYLPFPAIRYFEKQIHITDQNG